MSKKATRFLISGFFLAALAHPLLAQNFSDVDRLSPPYTVPYFGLGVGARALARGGAVMAIGDALLAVGSNPAGLAGLRGFEFTAGASAEGQSIGVPDIAPYDTDIPLYHRYGSTAYGYRLSGVYLDHATAAARIKAGPQTFVAALSWRRGLGLPGSYTFSTTRYDPRAHGFIPPDTSFYGELQGADDYAFDKHGTLNILTASVAFRLFKNVDLGCSLNIRTGRAESSEDLSFSYGLSDNGEVRLSWEGYERHTDQVSFSGGTNVEFGLLWTWRWLAVAATLKTGYSLDAAGPEQRDSLWTVSYGDTYENHSTGSFEYAIHSPTQIGFGLALRPADRLTFSAEYRGSEGGGDWRNWVVPLFRDEFRGGVEYRIGLGALELPVRAGSFFIKSNRAGFFSNDQLSGICFGSGLDLGRLTLDVGVLAHSATWGPNYYELGPFKRSAWNVTVTISYHLGETGK